MRGTDAGRDLGIPLWAETRSRHKIDVATYGSLQEGRDLVLVSRPGFGVATWIGLSGVATPI